MEIEEKMKQAAETFLALNTDLRSLQIDHEGIIVIIQDMRQK